MLRQRMKIYPHKPWSASICSLIFIARVIFELLVMQVIFVLSFWHTQYSAYLFRYSPQTQRNSFCLLHIIHTLWNYFILATFHQRKWTYTRFVFFIYFYFCVKKIRASINTEICSFVPNSVDTLDIWIVQKWNMWEMISRIE